MVCLTASELDTAVRPLDFGARDALCARWRARWRAAPRPATAWCTRVVAEIRRRQFSPLKFVTECRTLGRHLTAIVAVFARETRLPSVS